MGKGPFDPIIKTTDIHPDGAIFARGLAMIKGKCICTSKHLNWWCTNHCMQCEVHDRGRRRSRLDNLGDFVKTNKSVMRRHTYFRHSIIANDTPSITTGLKGLSYLEVEVTGQRDLHWGCTEEPLLTLSIFYVKWLPHWKMKTTTSLSQASTIKRLSRAERSMARAPFLENYKKALDLGDVHGEKDTPPWSEPAYAPL